MQKLNYPQMIINFFALIVFSVGGGIFGFIGGFFFADFKHSREMKAMEWQLLDSPVKFTQLVDANSSTVWAQDADKKIYSWNFNCSLQQKCNQWIETQNIDNNIEVSMEKNNTCLFSRESAATPSKEPPGKIVECGRLLFFNFYVLLEDGTIWHWEIPYPGDGFPSEAFTFAFVGIILAATASMIIFFLQTIESREQTGIYSTVSFFQSASLAFHEVA